MQALSRAAPLLALIVLTAVAFWPGLRGDFLFDDFPNIVSNPKIHATQLDADSLSRAATAYEPGTYGRPLATISFAIDHRIGGKDPFAYKVSSLLVHIANALLIFLLLRRIFSLDGLKPSPLSVGAALAATLFWALHPLQVSTVLYIVQRMETLSLTFVLLGLLSYLHGRSLQIQGLQGWCWIVGAALLAAIGLLSKETAALFPIYTLALELTVLRFHAKRPQDARLLKLAYSAGTAVAVLIFVLVLVPQYAQPSASEFRGFTVVERLLTQLRVLSLYLGQILLPLPESMTFYYDDYVASSGLFTPITTFFGAVLVFGLLSSAWILRERMPVYALGILLFFSAHVITSNIIPLELVFEHRNYFAILGIAIALTDLIRRIPTRDGPAIVRLGVVVILAGIGILTLIRSATWSDPLLLASDLVAKNPDSPRASNDLATLYAGMADNNPNSPFYSFAVAEFERGAALPGSSPLPEHGLILLAIAAEEPVDDNLWGSLINKLRDRPLGTAELLAVQGLLSNRMNGFAMDDVRLSEAYSVLAERQGLPAPLLARFGDHAINKLGSPELANRMFLLATERSVNDRGFILRMISVLIDEGHFEQAASIIRRATELGVTGLQG